MIKIKLSYLILISLLLIITIACGGGGGAGNSVAGTSGIGDDPFAKPKIIVANESIDKIEVVDSKGDSKEFTGFQGNIVELDIQNDLFSVRAYSPGGKVLRRRIDLTETQSKKGRYKSDKDYLIDENSTVIDLYLDNQDKSQVKNLLADLENFWETIVPSFSSSQSSSRDKNAGLTLLSIKEAVIDANDKGEGANLIESNFITDTLVENYKVEALRTIVTITGSIELETATGYFRATTITEINTNSQELAELLPLRSYYIDAGVNDSNNKPVANAGNDISTGPGDKVVLNAMRSYDPDGDELSFSWHQNSGDTIILDNNGLNNPGNSSQISFTAPHKEDEYIFTVKVYDGKETVEDSISVNVDFSLVNNPPQAIASHQTVEFNEEVTLDGSYSVDSDGDTLLYIWEQISGPEVILLYSATVTPNFVAPNSATTLTFRLTVNDGKTVDSTDINVTVVPSTSNNTNQKPQINSLPTEAVIEGEIYTYKMELHDPDGDTLEVVINQGPEGIIYDNTSTTLTWLSSSTNTITTEISVSDGQDSTTQAWDINIISNGLTIPAQLNKSFTKDIVLDFKGGEVDVSDIQISDNVEVQIKCKELQADSFNIEGSFNIEIE